MKLCTSGLKEKYTLDKFYLVVTNENTSTWKENDIGPWQLHLPTKMNNCAFTYSELTVDYSTVFLKKAPLPFFVGTLWCLYVRITFTTTGSWREILAGLWTFVSSAGVQQTIFAKDKEHTTVYWKKPTLINDPWWLEQPTVLNPTSSLTNCMNSTKKHDWWGRMRDHRCWVKCRQEDVVMVNDPGGCITAFMRQQFPTEKSLKSTCRLACERTIFGRATRQSTNQTGCLILHSSARRLFINGKNIL